MDFYRLSGGQFVDEFDQPDLVALLQQIGAFPAAQGLQLPTLLSA